MDTTAGRARSAKTPAQTFALGFGIVYLAVGVIGFAVTGFDGFLQSTFNERLIVFPLNPAHNIVHLLIGGGWLAASRTHVAAKSANLAIGGVYLLVFLLGILGFLNWLAIPAGFNPDQVLHVLSGALGVYFGTAVAGDRQKATA